MKKINTLFVILFAAMAFCGCGNSLQEAQVKKPDSIQQKEQKNKTSELFEVKDGVLIRYKGSYQTERKIILPESVKVIGKKAFSLSEKEKCMIYKLKTSTLEIPSDVKINEYAFSGAGPLKVTLAEGRKMVEKSVFRGMGKYGSDSEVILANSIEVIDEYAFYKGECVKVKLGSGLQQVKKYGLNGVIVRSLPDNLKQLDEESLGDSYKYVHNMPEHLERLGTHCIRINKEGRIQISASVKYIAKNAVVWENSGNGDEMGFDVAEANPNYKSDENGWLYSKDGKIMYFAYLIGDEFVIPDGVEKVYKDGLYLYEDGLAKGTGTVIVGEDRVKFF